jgi:hypothetical protein
MDLWFGMRACDRQHLGELQKFTDLREVHGTVGFESISWNEAFASLESQIKSGAGEVPYALRQRNSQTHRIALLMQLWSICGKHKVRVYRHQTIP